MQAIFFRFCEISFSGFMQIAFKFFHDVVCFGVILNFKVCRRFGYVDRLAAGVTEFPPLIPVHVRESVTARAAYHQVHLYFENGAAAL